MSECDAPRGAIVVMGVSGCGKSSVGAALCERIGARLIEGDDFHPEQNIIKMKAGVPLTDDDRQGWLERLSQELAQAVASNQIVVLTCSALKRRYRDTLRDAVTNPGFVFLELSATEAARRVGHRPDHFMPITLVDSQFRDLEPPTGEPGVLMVNATDPLSDIVNQAEAWWRIAQAAQ